MAQPDFRLLDTELPYKIGGAAIQGMTDVNALRSQQLQNQAAEFEIKNALAEQEAYKQAAQTGNVQQNLLERGLGKQAAAYGKTTAEAQKLGLDAQKLGLEAQYKKVELQRARMGQLAANPSDENIMGSLQQQLQSGEISPQQAQQAWGQVQGMNPQQRAEYFTKMGVTLDTLYKTQAQQQERMQGTVPAGYRMTGQGTLEAIPGGPTTTPLAPKELQKRNADFPAAKAAIEGYESKADKFVDDLKALRDHPGLDSITGIIAGRVPGVTGEGRAAQALYDKIVAKGGFQALQDLRAASKTGGALGNVSNQEGKQLVQSFAAIDRKQNAEDVRAALDQAIADVEGSKTRMREAYDSTYEYKLGGGSPAPTNASVVGGNTPAAQAHARYLAAKKGK